MPYLKGCDGGSYSRLWICFRWSDDTEMADGIAYNITVTSQWPSWRLKSHSTICSIVWFSGHQRKRQRPRYWLFWGESTGDHWIPLTNGHFLESLNQINITCSELTPSVSAMCVMIVSIINIACGAPNPRRAVFEDRFVLHKYPVACKFFRRYVLSQWNKDLFMTWKKNSAY